MRSSVAARTSAPRCRSRKHSFRPAWRFCRTGTERSSSSVIHASRWPLRTSGASAQQQDCQPNDRTSISPKVFADCNHRSGHSRPYKKEEPAPAMETDADSWSIASPETGGFRLYHPAAMARARCLRRVPLRGRVHAWTQPTTDATRGGPATVPGRPAWSHQSSSW